MGLRVDNPIVPVWRTNNSHVPFKQLDNNLLNYLDSLPIDLQKNIYVTSSVGGKHSKNSRHYKGRALDIRIDKTDPLNDPLFKYLGETAEERKKSNIVVLDPMHGSAPHIHLSYGEGTENNFDYFYGSNKKEHKKHDHDHDHEVLRPINIPTISLPTPEESVNQQMINDIQMMMEATKKAQEEENNNTKLAQAKQTLMQKEDERKRAISFINELKLNYTPTKY